MLFKKKHFIFAIFIIYIYTFSWAIEPLIQPTQEAPSLLKKRIQSWIQELGNDADKQAFPNLRRIGEIAIPQLLEGLKTKNPTAKRKIIEILTEFYNLSFISIFHSILQNETEDPRIRETAIIALEKYNTEDVLKILQKYSTHHDTRIQRAACYTICQYNNSNSIPYLIQLLKHWDADIQNKAYNKLRDITKQNQLSPQYNTWEKWWKDYQEIWEDEFK